MIRHIVLTKFKPNTEERLIQDIYDGLAALCEKLDFAREFKGGRSESPEQLERGYTHGFVIDFDDWQSLQRYADHPEHKAFGGQIIANAVDGLSGVLVMDIEV